MRSVIPSVFLISAAALLCGCQSTKQNYQIVSVNELALTNIDRFRSIIMSYEKFRKVSMENWECYAPDEKPDETFFCANKGEISVIFSALGPPTRNVNSNERPPLDPQNEAVHDHGPDSPEDYPHHD